MKRKEVLCAVIGGVVGAVLVMAAGSIAPLGAQNEAADAEFGTITCRELLVGDDVRTQITPAYVSIRHGEKGGRSVLITRDHVGLYKDGAPQMIMDSKEHGGRVTVYGKDGESVARMSISENGGGVAVRGKDGGGGAAMAITEYGGFVRVSGKDGGGTAAMSIHEYGGSVDVSGKDGGGGAQIVTGEYGGAVHVFGRGDFNMRAAMGVDEYGNGAVSTWDKNGYRIANLK